MNAKDFSELKKALLKMMDDYMEDYDATRSEVVDLFIKQHPRASLDAALVPSPHSEDFPDMFDEYEKAALIGLLANPNYSALGDETIAGYAEDAARSQMNRRAARKATSTPEGAQP